MTRGDAWKPTIDVRSTKQILLALLVVSVGFGTVGWFVGGGRAAPVNIRGLGPGPGLERTAFEPRSAQAARGPLDARESRDDLRAGGRPRIPIGVAMGRIVQRKEIR